MLAFALFWKCFVFAYVKEMTLAQAPFAANVRIVFPAVAALLMSLITLA